MKKELQNAAPSSMLSFNIPIHFRQAGQVVGRLLIQEVVQPVGKQQVGVRPPGVDGRLGGVIMREVVARHLNGQPLVKIPQMCIRDSYITLRSGQGRFFVTTPQRKEAKPFPYQKNFLV